MLAVCPPDRTRIHKVRDEGRAERRGAAAEWTGGMGMPPAGDNATGGAPAVRCCGNRPKRAGRAGMGGAAHGQDRIFAAPRAPRPVERKRPRLHRSSRGPAATGNCCAGWPNLSPGPACREVARWFRGYRSHRPHACHFEPQRTRSGSRCKKRSWAEKIPHRLDSGCAAALPAVEVAAKAYFCSDLLGAPQAEGCNTFGVRRLGGVGRALDSTLLARLPNNPSLQKRHTPSRESAAAAHG